MHENDVVMTFWVSTFQYVIGVLTGEATGVSDVWAGWPSPTLCTLVYPTRTCRVRVQYNCVMCVYVVVRVRACTRGASHPWDPSWGGVRIRSSRPRARGGRDGRRGGRGRRRLRSLGGLSDPYAIYYIKWNFPLLASPL